MILFILPLIALAASNLIGGIDYLFKLLFPPVPNTIPLSKPYTPPFTGGQCAIYYSVYMEITIQRTTGNVIEYRSFLAVNGQSKRGAIRGFRKTKIVLVGGRVDLEVFLLHSDAQGNLSETRILQTGADENIDLLPVITSLIPDNNQVDSCGNLPNPNPTLPIGGNGLPSSPPPVLYPPPNSPPNTPPTTPNNNWFQLIAGAAALVGAASAAAASAAAAAAGTAITAGAAASAAGAAASASAPSGSTTQKQADSQKLSGDALVGIARVLAEISKQIQELEKEVRKLKTGEAKKEKDDAKKVIRYDFGSANRDGFIDLYPESNPDSYEATFVDVQIFNIPSGSGRYFGDKSPHYYKYKSLGQVHFVSPTFGILESREIDFARLSLNVPDNCFGFFYHFGLDGVVSANLSCFYTKIEKQAV